MFSPILVQPDGTCVASLGLWLRLPLLAMELAQFWATVIMVGSTESAGTWLLVRRLLTMVTKSLGVVGCDPLATPTLGKATATTGNATANNANRILSARRHM